MWVLSRWLLLFWKGDIDVAQCKISARWFAFQLPQRVLFFFIVHRCDTRFTKDSQCCQELFSGEILKMLTTQTELKGDLYMQVVCAKKRFVYHWDGWFEFRAIDWLIDWLINVTERWLDRLIAWFAECFIKSMAKTSRSSIVVTKDACFCFVFKQNFKCSIKGGYPHGDSRNVFCGAELDWCPARCQTPQVFPSDGGHQKRSLAHVFPGQGQRYRFAAHFCAGWISRQGRGSAVDGEGVFWSFDTMIDRSIDWLIVRRFTAADSFVCILTHRHWIMQRRRTWTLNW